jgi:hypothetical protein
LLHDIALAAVGPRDAGILLAGKVDGSLWRSADRGESWDQLGAWLPFERLFLHPARESLVLGQAAALIHQPLGTGEILRSEDRGSTWSVTPTGLDGFSFV